MTQDPTTTAIIGALAGALVATLGAFFLRRLERRAQRRGMIAALRETLRYNIEALNSLETGLGAETTSSGSPGGITKSEKTPLPVKLANIPPLEEIEALDQTGARKYELLDPVVCARVDHARGLLRNLREVANFYREVWLETTAPLMEAEPAAYEGRRDWGSRSLEPYSKIFAERIGPARDACYAAIAALDDVSKSRWRKLGAWWCRTCVTSH